MVPILKYPYHFYFLQYAYYSDSYVITIFVCSYTYLGPLSSRDWIVEWRSYRVIYPNRVDQFY